MNEKMPHTPFSTPLSGSAKETELRLRSIFSGPKRRPPLPFLALVFAACLLCGNLVSCQRGGTEPTDPASSSSSQSGSASDGLADEEARWMLYWEDVIPKLVAQREDYTEGDPLGEVVLNMTGEDLNLLMVAWTPGVHAGGLRNLLLGTFDQECELVDYYDIGGDAGLWKAWDEADGMHLICANTVTWQGWESGGLPCHFRFDGKTLEVVDLPQSIREQDSEEQLYKYLPLPGAVEVYKRTEGWDNSSRAWQGVPQWEYQGTVLLTPDQVDPIPTVVRDVARDYIAHADWEGVPTAGTPVLRLEEMAEWTDFSQLSLCSQWKGLENLTLSAWDLDYGAPSNPYYYMNGQTHLLFLRDGEELTFLTTFYDGYPLDFPPEQELLAGLSPYNWYAVEALYDAGYLTARPKLANIFTKVPAPQQAQTLAEECLEREGLTLRIDAMEPKYFCVEEPHWMGVYAIETSRLQNGAWEKQPTRLGFFKLSSFRSFEMCVYTMPEAEINILDAQTRAAAHGLVDYEVALWDLQYPDFPTAYGPGNYDGVFTVQGSTETTTTPGDIWTEYGDRFEAQYRYGGWNNRFCTRLDTTRRLPTTRGAKLGDSRARVRELYPELRADPFPGLEGDYLWYCAGQPETLASLIFFFEDDAVSRLVLTAPLEGRSGGD